jgi:2,4-dienoyl-CoA reductase (NADPH2)
MHMLKTVFSPFLLNKLEIHNRILMSSMHLNFEGDSQYERLARFYALRAKDGPGIIVTAGCSPDLAGRATLDGFALDGDELIDKHRLITAAVHAAGPSKIALQLLHFGREAFHGRLVAPSPLRLPGSLFMPAAIRHEEILETVSSYATAAQRAVEAGYDAIELLFSQGFLIHQFLSPHTNQRKDMWGGELKARMAFALQVASAVREAVGPHFPIIYRIPCMDLLPHGLSFEDSMALVEALSCHQIDLLNISIGWHESSVPTLANVVPQAGFAATALRVKQRFPQLLTCVSNRINDLRIAEELLLAGTADVAAMARPFLADRNIISKSLQHRFDDISGCIGCNQDCLDHMFLGQEIGCSVNPECGTPEDGVPPLPLPAGTRIAVVGGGLAGMSAACHLSQRGAAVTLFERDGHLGGQMRLAAKIPSKSEFAGTVRSLETRLRQSGVRVMLMHEFTPADMRSQAWSHVVVATGTEPNFSAFTAEPCPVPGAMAAPEVQILGWHDILDKDLPVAHPVVIYGGGGVACDLAKFLLAKRRRESVSDDYMDKYQVERLVGELPALPNDNRPITIAQRSSKKIGYKLGRTTRWITMNELEAKGVQMLRSASLEGVCAEGVNLLVQGEHRTIPARTLVMATGQRPLHETLCNALAQAGLRFTVIGAASAGATEPASISFSIKSGYLFATRQVDELLRPVVTPERESALS